MRLTAKTYADLHLDDNKKLVVRMVNEMPSVYAEIYKKELIKVTPKRTSWLRRSVTVRADRASVLVKWRAKYAGVQQAGGRHVNGKWVEFKKYTTPGTGKDFARIANKEAKKKFKEEFKRRSKDLL